MRCHGKLSMWYAGSLTAREAESRGEGAPSRIPCSGSRVGRATRGSEQMPSSGDNFRGTIVAVSRSETHSFTKANRDAVRLIEGFGIEGDAHGGPTVKHRSRVSRDPTHPNLRQVHLIHAELLDELGAAGFDVSPG